MKTQRVNLPSGPDEFLHTCPGRVDGEACRWVYAVTRVQDDIDDHEQQRHDDADAAWKQHVDEYHPHAKPEPHGGAQ